MDFGFVGPTYVAASPTQDIQDCYNWYCEVDPNKKEGERGVIALLPCPGLVQLLQSSTIGAVRAFRVLPGGATMLAVIGNKLKSINLAYAETDVGTLLTSTGPVSITDNGVSAYIVDGGNRYSYNYVTTAFVTLADGAFNGANTTDIVDNFIVYNNPNSNQWGCANVGSTVSGALNFASTLVAPGNIIGLICDHRQVFIFAEYTSEVWINVGTFPFPFAIVSGTSTQHGCAARGSIARLGESFALLEQDSRGKAIVIMMNGYTPIRISTHAVEQAISQYSIISDAVAYSYQQNGHEFYVLTFPTADATWCYDLATGLWHKRAWRDSNNVLHRHRSNCGAIFGGRTVVGDWQNGKIYELSQSVYTDNGDALACIRVCRHLTSDLKRQFFSSLQLQFQPGVGISTGQGSNPQAILEWSDDGGQTYGNQHFAGIGQMGQFKNRAIWRQLGQARDRIYKVTVTDPVYRAIISAELDASVGAH